MNLGPQKSPSSTAKIQAESKYIQKMLNKYSDKAYKIAKMAHQGQKRWNGSDYFDNHVYIVAQIANYYHLYLPQTWIDNIDCVVASAYLHDVVEDTSVTLEDLSKDFPPLIIDMVNALTHKKDEGYFDYIMRIHNSLYGARYIKLCDLAHNISNLDPKRNKNMYDKYKFAQYILHHGFTFYVENIYV